MKSSDLYSGQVYTADELVDTWVASLHMWQGRGSLHLLGRVIRGSSETGYIAQAMDYSST